MNDLLARVGALRARIDRVSVEPGAIQLPMTRFARPLLRLFGAFQELDTRTAALTELLRAIPPDPSDGDALRGLLSAPLDRAVVELEQEVARAERSIVVHGELPSGHATWLARRLRALVRVAIAIQPGDGREASLARGIRPVDVAAPLGLRAEGAATPPAPSSEDGGAEIAAASRLISLQIAAIDHVAEAARAETAVLARRRRLFEAARRLLLDASATLPLDPAGVDVRARAIAEEIVAIDRIEAAGVDPRVGLVHQARAALADGDERRLHAALVGLEGVAIRGGDAAVAGVVARGLAPLWQQGGRHAPSTLRSSEDRSAEDTFGGDVARAVRTAARTARRAAKEVVESNAPRGQHELAQLVLDYLTPGAASDTMRVMLAADGFFDVGGTLTPVRVTETETIARMVRHPTTSMALVRATEPLDVLSAVVEDPRLVWLSLAAGRLLTRKFIAHETRERTRVEQRGEVRVYLVDGSGSMMKGDAARARMRDALLLCELATLLRRVTGSSAQTRLTLHYGFFTRELGEIRRVATADEAIAAIGDVVGTGRKGGTDIQGALLESFAIVKRARERDGDLGRAQIVLVSDGCAPVDEAAIDEARREAGDVPIGLSVIALGEENPALRNLVARQRAAGERAFYHFVPDATLTALVAGEATSWLGALHAPDLPDLPDAPDAPGTRTAAADLARRAIEDALLELADLEEARHREALGGEGALAGEGELGRREAVRGEDRALGRRFARWFGDGTEKGVRELSRPSEEAADVDAIRMVMGTVAEVTAELGGRDDARLVDAIDLAERLIREAGIAPSRYAELVAAYPEAVADERASVRRAARPWGEGGAQAAQRSGARSAP